MSQGNAEIVRRMYEAQPELQDLLQKGGSLIGHPWLSKWHPECVLEELAEVPDAAVYHGRDEVAGFFERGFREVWSEWSFVPGAIVEGPDGVFAEVENYGRSKAGLEVKMQIFQVFRILEGMIVYANGYTDRKRAREAVGLSG